MIDSVSEVKIRVRYAETDQMGHAYYANYFVWFEVARAAWCRARGFSYKSLEEMGFMLPAVEANATYKREIKYDDEITVRVFVTEIRRATIKFNYQIVRGESGEVLCSEGYTWHVLMGQERKAVTIPPHVREMLDREPQNL